MHSWYCNITIIFTSLVWADGISLPFKKTMDFKNYCYIPTIVSFYGGLTSPVRQEKVKSTRLRKGVTKILLCR